MNTITLPSICPFGDKDDAATLSFVTSRYYVLPITPADDFFIRIFTSDDGEVSYMIQDKVSTEQGLCEYARDAAEDATVKRECIEKFREWGFAELLSFLGLGQTDPVDSPVELSASSM